MIKNVMNLFFPHQVVLELAPNLELIIDTTFALIQSHEAWVSKLEQRTVKISFELLSLISDEREDFKNYIATCCLMKNFKPECYNLFTFAVQKHQKLRQKELF